MANNTPLPISDTLKTAWNKMYGAKSSIWAALILSQIILFVTAMLSGALTKSLPIIGVIIIGVVSIIFGLMQMGIYYMGIQQAKGIPISYKDMFYPVSTELGLKVICLIILEGLAFLIPTILAVFASIFANYGGVMIFLAAIFYIATAFTGLYILLSMILSMGYVLMEKMGPVAAIQRSFKATRSSLVELFAVYLLFFIIYFLLSLPLGIGLIWGIPFGYVLYGEVYLRLANNA